MSQATERWKSFAIKQAWVSEYSDGGAATWVLIPVVAGSTLDISRTAAEIRDGEGFLQYTWFHTITATLTIRAKEWSMRVLEMISGNPVSSAGGVDWIEFGRDEELSPPTVRFRLQCPAVDETGTVTGKYMYVYCYKVQCSFPSVGMEEVTPGEVTIEGNCLRCDDDDQGNDLPGDVFGRIEALVA
jgi:hypothetical protein